MSISADQIACVSRTISYIDKKVNSIKFRVLIYVVGQYYFSIIRNKE